MSYINQPKKHKDFWERNLKNQLSDFVFHEKLITTYKRARLVQQKVEKLITIAKEKNLSNIRYIKKNLISYDDPKKKLLHQKFFDNFAVKYQNRPGGYTRITKLYHRKGDNTLYVKLSFVDEK
ncbi:50S ribosomal protein L17 [symbiont of Argiope bruennichi]|uniref:50S ribosomal protein L17 n=1 Tax=symbiont of Argiope bruennichi TaxID=2810479 RepID=UPI003DA26C6C